MIKDDRGKIPTFIIKDGHIVHQSSGMKEPIFGPESMRDMNIRQAMLRLRVKMMETKAPSIST